jgi:hypothetical protein
MLQLIFVDGVVNAAGAGAVSVAVPVSVGDADVGGLLDGATLLVALLVTRSLARAGPVDDPPHPPVSATAAATVRARAMHAAEVARMASPYGSRLAR